MGKSRLCTHQHFNPRSPYGERPLCTYYTSNVRYFNPRSPYGERPCPCSALAVFSIFQSTLPVRGATRGALLEFWKMVNFNPRSPYGERRLLFLIAKQRGYFNPRSPYGERRVSRNIGVKRSFISIHAPRTGSDRCGGGLPAICPDFNPRSPYGERHIASVWPINTPLFQSTLPVRGATARCRTSHTGFLRFQSTLPVRGATVLFLDYVHTTFISIHAPRTGSDFGSPCQDLSVADFNPRSPYGERQLKPGCFLCGNIISIHAPRTGSDQAGKAVLPF